MEDYINKDLLNLETLAAIRSENLVEYTLDAVLEKVEDKSKDLEALSEAAAKRYVYERALMDYVPQYISEIVEGKMLVTEYVEKNRSKQFVYVFLGTHWQLADVQLYYMFVKRCTKKMGVDDLYCEDPCFMNKVNERLAYRVMDYRKQASAPDTVMINLMNGTLAIRKNGCVELREHRAEDFFTYVLPYVYSKNAKCPKWHRFLDRVLPEKEMQTLLAEYIGYCFTQNLKLEKMAVFYGTGSNGKSVCLDIITRIMGSCNVSNVTLSALTCDDEKRSLIEGKLANISHESNGQLDTAMLKQIVSGEPTEVRVLYRGTHTMRNIPKLFTSYNRLPSTESTYGFFRRWILFPFNVTIPETEQDVDLVAKLTKELPGILNWVLVALTGLLERKAFGKSDTCQSALGEYIKGANSALSFFTAKCEVDDDARMKLSDLYKAYTQYCNEEEMKRFGKKNFQEIIRNFGAKSVVYNGFISYTVKVKEEEKN